MTNSERSFTKNTIVHQEGEAKMSTFTLLYNQPKELWEGTGLAELSEFAIQSILPTFSWKEARGKIVAILEETPNTKTYVLKTNRQFRDAKPGEHFLVTKEVQGKRITRTYSSSSRVAGRTTITVKRTKGGLFSNALFEGARVGDLVYLGEPQGEFLLPKEEVPLLYLAGGSGITPIHSHLVEIAKSSRKEPVHLFYFSTSPEEIIFKKELQLLEKANPWFHLHLFVDRGGKEGISESLFQESLVTRSFPQWKDNRTLVYVSGPVPLKNAVKQAFAEKDVVSEDFGGPTGNLSQEADVSRMVQVKLANSHRSVEVPTNLSLLEGLEAQGIYPPSGCRMGICHSCICKKSSGDLISMENGEEVKEETVRICITKPVSDLELEL